MSNYLQCSAVFFTPSSVWFPGGERGIILLWLTDFVTNLLSVRVRLRSAGSALVRRPWALRAAAPAQGAQQGFRLCNWPHHWEGQGLWCLPGHGGLHQDSDAALAWREAVWPVRLFPPYCDLSGISSFGLLFAPSKMSKRYKSLITLTTLWMINNVLVSTCGGAT